MFLFSTDIDGTVYDGDASAKRFADFWNSLKEKGENPVLAYNTGRSLDDVVALIDSTPLPTGDFIIAGVGTEIFDVSRNEIIAGWKDELSAGWNYDEVLRIVPETAPGIEPQPPECQNPFKCSWFWHGKSSDDLKPLGDALKGAGLDAQIVYSSSRDLDVLPSNANKGNAVTWLAKYLEIPTTNVVVAGDSGNDSAMYGVKGAMGIVVANAESALREAVGQSAYYANAPCAEGVIEGLHGFLRRHGAPA